MVNLHHIGYACKDINSAITHLKLIYKIEKISDVIFDKLQNASVCLIELTDSSRIELVAGEAVKNITKNAITLYHVCYEVEDIYKSIEQYKAAGAVMISEVKPAVLFNGRLVVFLQTELGLIELLEKEKVDINTSRKSCVKPAISTKETILISSNFNTELVSPFIEYLCQSLNLNFESKILGYNQVFQLLLDNNNEFHHNTNGFNLMFIKLDDWIHAKDETIAAKSYMQTLANIAEEIIRAFRNIRENESNYIVCLCPPSPTFIQPQEVAKSYYEVEDKIYNELCQYKNLYCLKTASIIDMINIDGFYDPISNNVGHIPYCQEFFAGLALISIRTIHAFKRKPYKLIVVDCDNTLWNGVCAEVGVSGIVLTEGRLSFQKKLLNLYNAGILLCLCSKNNESDVMAVLEIKDNMLLRKEHFVYNKINWEKKSKNIIEISETLNINLEDIIFIDDNPIECQEVVSNLPQVLTIHLPQNDQEIIAFCRDSWIFDYFKITEVDHNRNIYYKQHIERKKFQDSAYNFKEFLENLKLNINIKPYAHSEADRISQLTKRTNQFNFTNEVKSESEILHLDKLNQYCLIVDVSDRFGDYGLVGVIIYQINDKKIIVTTFLLSCRALGKGVEHAMLRKLAKIAHGKLATEIVLTFTLTKRNEPAHQFLENIGAKKELQNDGKCYYILSVDAALRVKYDIDENLNRTRIEKNNNLTNSFLRETDNKVINIVATSYSSANKLLAAYKLSKQSHDLIYYKSNKIESSYEEIVSLWQDILNIKIDYNEDADFFHLGGDSLLATQLISKIYKLFGVELSLREIYDTPTIGSLSTLIHDKQIKNRQIKLHPITNIQRNNSLKLSFSQYWLWFIDQIDQVDQNSWYYNTPVTFHLRGNLNVAALKQAFMMLINRHEALRTNFKYENGELVQLIAKDFNLIFKIEDVSLKNYEQILEVLDSETRQAFRLDKDLLIRVMLLKKLQDEYILIITCHHIVSDGWSFNIIARELSYFYNQITEEKLKSLPPLPVQYADFSEWQHQNLTYELAAKQLQYWQQQLKNLSQMNLPVDYQRRSTRTHNGKYIPLVFDKSITNLLNAIAKQEKTSLFAILLSCFAILMAKICKQNDIAIVSPVSGRHYPSVENLIGCFVNLLTLRISISYEYSFKEFLNHNRELILEAYANQDIPFAKVIENIHIDRESTHNSIFQVMFVMQNMYQEKLELKDINVEHFRKGYNAARLEIILELEEVDGYIEGGIYYNTDIFNENTIEKLIFNYKMIVHKITNSHEEKLKNLLDFDIQQNNNNFIPIVETNSSVMLVHQLFEKYAKNRPHSYALQYGAEKMTYAQLNSISNQLASYLKKEGVVKGSIIVLAMKPSFDLIISIVSCYKLGCTYVPLDVNAPTEYNNNIIHEVKPRLIITHDPIANKFNVYNIKLLNLNAVWSIINNLDTRNLLLDICPNSIAYIIYTSGTSGRPKGVMITHANLSSLLNNTKDLYSFNSSDKMVLFHSCAFDFSVWEIWIALCHGAKLIILQSEITSSAQDFYNLIIEEDISVINQTPSAFYQLSLYQQTFKKPSPKNLRLIILGGEALNPANIAPWLTENPNCKVYNMYGITEITIHATYIDITPEIAKSSKSLVGKPLPGYEIYILDEQLKEVAPGVAGEIFIGGCGVAKGYFKQDGLTANSFIDNPFDTNSISKIYKSGDVGKYTTCGNIEFISRSEHQAKVRGYRVDLHGIAHVLSQHEGVEISFINVTDKANIAAYVIPNYNLSYPILQLVKLQQSGELTNKTLYELPNGMTVAHLNKNETDYLYNEIFIEQEYFKHGIVVNPGDTIIDVGANIGFFSLFVDQLHENIKIYAFEPVKEVFSILETNAKLYGIDIECFNYGLYSDNESRELVFYSNFSILSGTKAETKEDSQITRNYLKNIYSSDSQSLIREDEIDILLQDKFEGQVQKCKFMTLSSFIKNYAIEAIDLLKIDTEKSELEVIKGIQEQDWLKINQAVVEVHDIDGALNYFINLFQKHGFKLVIDQNQLLKDTNLYTIYASRLPGFNSIECAINYNMKFRWASPNKLAIDIKEFLNGKLPSYMIPIEYHFLESIPLTKNGKLNLLAANTLSINHDSIPKTEAIIPINEFEAKISQAWSEVLGKDNINVTHNFFDVGGNSLLTMQLYAKLEKYFPGQLRIIDFFRYSTIRSQAKYLAEKMNASFLAGSPNTLNDLEYSIDENAIAVIGMSGRFPQANNISEYWHNIINNVDVISHFSDDDLLNQGIDINLINNPNYIKASGIISEPDLFDADFFGFSTREAIVLDPQMRIFFELAWHALENSGYCVDKFTGKIGIYAGMSNNRYFDFLNKHADSDEKLYDHIFLELGNEKDYLATRIAYKLGLTGSAININTACSTSLVAIIKACQSLILGENDIVLAGGVSVLLPERVGYLYVKDGILSSDGICRPFDFEGNGTVLGSGAGIVVLKRLTDAIRDRDNIKTVIKGYAVNNDGKNKIGFTAPSIEGQANCISDAMQHAKISPDTISYIETHGTGTSLGDPIEISSLISVFKHTKNSTEKSCALGSVKANIGHADAAAGVAGFIKVSMMLNERIIPPLTNFKSLNKFINLEETPFYVPEECKKWCSDGEELYAGISSFGIGGTNAHIILQSPPKVVSAAKEDEPQLIILSAKTDSALEAMILNLKQFLLNKISNEDIYPGYICDVAYTLQVGRAEFEYKRYYICYDVYDCVQKLDMSDNTLNVHSNSPIYSLDEIGKKWIKGETIDWHSLHKEKVRCRVELPLYPFERKSYWYTHLVENKNTTRYSNYQDYKPDSSLFVANDLLVIFKELLNNIDISETENLFNLGGDSLLALILLSKIKDKFNVELTLDDIYKKPTVVQLSEVIHSLLIKNNDKLSFLIKLKDGDSNKPPLFILHTPNGSLVHYNSFLQHFDYDGVIYGLQNPPANDRHSEFPSITNLAKKYSNLIEEYISGPCVLMGWSFGGSLAFEVARYLEMKDIAISKVILIDAWAKFSSIIQDKNFHTNLFVSRENYNLYANSLEEWGDIIWNRFTKLIEYTPSRIYFPVILFKAVTLFEEYQEVEDPFNHWQTYTGGNMKVYNINANHESIIRTPAIKEIAVIIQNEMAEARKNKYSSVHKDDRAIID